MVDHVIKRCDERDACQRGFAVSGENYSRAETSGHDADVFNRTVGKHGFEVVLGSRIKNSDQRGNRSYDEHDHARTDHPVLRDGQKVEIHTNDSVESQDSKLCRRESPRRWLARRDARAATRY